MADIGYGASVEAADGVSNAYVAFTNVTQITVPSEDQELVETTHLLSSNRRRTFTAGLISPVDWSFSQRYDKDAMSRAIALKGVTEGYKIKWADGSEAGFSAILMKTECELTNDAITDLKHTLRVSGAVTFTEGA